MWCNGYGAQCPSGFRSLRSLIHLVSRIGCRFWCYRYLVGCPYRSRKIQITSSPFSESTEHTYADVTMYVRRASRGWNIFDLWNIPPAIEWINGNVTYRCCQQSKKKRSLFTILLVQHSVQCTRTVCTAQVVCMLPPSSSNVDFAFVFIRFNDEIQHSTHKSPSEDWTSIFSDRNLSTFGIALIFISLHEHA